MAASNHLSVDYLCKLIGWFNALGCIFQFLLLPSKLLDELHSTVVRKLWSAIYTPVWPVLNPFSAFEPHLAMSLRCCCSWLSRLGAPLGSAFHSVVPWMHTDAKTHVWKAQVRRPRKATCQMLLGSIVPRLSQDPELLLRSKVWNVCHEGTMRIAWVLCVYVQNICIYQYINLWMRVCLCDRWTLAKLCLSHTM